MTNSDPASGVSQLSWIVFVLLELHENYLIVPEGAQTFKKAVENHKEDHLYTLENFNLWFMGYMISQF